MQNICQTTINAFQTTWFPIANLKVIGCGARFEKCVFIKPNTRIYLHHMTNILSVRSRQRENAGQAHTLRFSQIFTPLFPPLAACNCICQREKN